MTSLLLSFVCTVAPAQFPNPFTVPQAPGVEIAVINGTATSGGPSSLTPIGDFNGDGWDDFAIGYPSDSQPSTSSSGACAVHYGGPAWAGVANTSTSALNGTNGFVLFGDEDGDNLGTVVAGVGDVDGDGYDDLLVAAPGLENTSGVDVGGAYLLRGGAQVAPTGVLMAAAIQPPIGCVFRYAADGPRRNPTLAGIGDVNADGFADMALGETYEGLPLMSSPAPAIGERWSAAGDIDNDGDIDLVTTDNNLEQYTLHVNQGNGTLSPTTYPQPGNPSKVKLVDMDGDGDLDMVFAGVANTSLRRISIRRNLGSGLFAQIHHYPAANTALDFDVADFNGDGYPDIVRSDFSATSSPTGPNQIIVYVNDQTGVLTQTANWTTPLRPRLVRGGDADGDGDQDVLVYCADTNTLMAYANGGTATFVPVYAAPGVSLASNSFGYDMHVVDLDGDSDVDLVGALSTVMLNQGGFNFGPPTWWAAGGSALRSHVVDVDGDGDLDVFSGLSGGAFTTAVSVLRNAGDGSFPNTSWQFALGYVNIYDTAASDFDGDGDVDLAMTARVQSNPNVDSVVVVPNNGDGTFPGNWAGQLHVLWGSASVANMAAVELSQLTVAQGLRVVGRQGGELLGQRVGPAGDLNGDGVDDFVVTASGTWSSNGFGLGSAFVVFGRPGLTAFDVHSLSGLDGFTVRDTYDAGYLGYSLGTPADIDGDGFDDLTLGERNGQQGFGNPRGSAHIVFGGASVGSSGSIDLLVPDGVTKFQLLAHANNDLLAQEDFACVDINDDGRDDLLVGAPSSDELLNNQGVVYALYGAARPFPAGVISTNSLNGANGFRIRGETSNDNLGASIAPAGDVDGDGIEDVLLNDRSWSGGGLFGRAELVLGLRYGAPVVYCTAKLNSLACTPAIGWAGDLPSVTDVDAFHLVASQILNQKSGLLFYSTAGRHAAAFQGGTLCVRQPVRRTTLQHSGGSPSGDDCSGVLNFDWRTWMIAGNDLSLTVGVTVNAQYWSRDPQSSFGTNLSDGIEFTIGP